MKLAVALTLFATAAGAQQQCAPYDEVVSGLSRGYGETVVFTGMETGNALVQIFVNKESGTWTALAVSPDGTACLVASGGNAAITVESVVPGDPA